MLNLNFKIIILTKSIKTPEIFIEYLFELLSNIYNERKIMNLSTSFLIFTLYNLNSDKLVLLYPYGNKKELIDQVTQKFANNKVIFLKIDIVN